MDSSSVIKRKDTKKTAMASKIAILALLVVISVQVETTDFLANLQFVMFYLL